jgi:basic membrane protein A
MEGFTVKRAKLVALGCIGVLALAGCGGGSAGNDDAASSKDAIKVAVLIPGTANDGSWGEAVAEGAKAAAEEVGADLTIAENLNDTGQYQQQGNAFAAQGFDLVVTANGAMVSVVTDLAKKYQDVKFGVIGHIESPGENVRAVTPNYWEGTFSAGYLAGLMSKTGVVGMIGGFEFPIIASEMEGFALGARYAKPDIAIKRQYVNTWTDAGVAASATEAMVADGADIVFSATDQATQGIFKTMQDRPDHYVVPQYLDKHDQAPGVVITSVLYGLDEITGSFIRDVADDKWTSENAAVTVADHIKLAPFHELESKVSADAKTKLEQVQGDLASGALVLPGIDVLGKTGAADAVELASLKK